MLAYIIQTTLFTMILMLLALIMAATADPDYYAVKIETERFKIFTKISQCTGAMYQSGDNRVLFQDGVWKIAEVENGPIDCKISSSVIEEKYRTKKTQFPKDNEWIERIDVNKTEQNGYTTDEWILIKSFNKGVDVELTGIILVRGAGTMEENAEKEDCLRNDWGKKHPENDKDIVVAFQDSKCLYDFVDQAELERDNDNSIIIIHQSGKTEI